MNDTKTLSVKPRDYLFDNYKALLITLVIIGHFIEPCYQNNDFLYTLKWLIVSFHMPAFIFISGYFSKRELPLSIIIRKLLIPYIVYEFVYYFFLYICFAQGDGTSSAISEIFFVVSACALCMAHSYALCKKISVLHAGRHHCRTSDRLIWHAG